MTLLARLVRPLLLLLTASSLAGIAQATPISAVYAFGDSLSQNGQNYAITHFPPPPYFEGRSSNGPVAVERLATDKHLSLFDYAVGGATTGATGVLAQVDTYRFRLGGQRADADGLYFIWAGGNDLLAGPDFSAAITPAVDNLSTAVQRLYGLGARHFMLPLLPDLGAIPRLRQGGTAISAAASAATFQFDAALAARLHGLASGLPGSSILVFDTLQLQNALVADPARLGITNTRDACLHGALVCADPSQYLFWDDIHPTAVVHAYWGDAFAAAIPEPGGQALWIVGLFGAGFAQRRFRRAPPALVTPA
jgi:phospholipase/lecithinase/hemolysin